jgi:hypothetical protein
VRRRFDRTEGSHPFTFANALTKPVKNALSNALANTLSDAFKNAFARTDSKTV